MEKKLLIWWLLSLVTSLVPPQYQPIARGARRVISLTPVFALYPGQEQLLNNSFRASLKLTTRQLVLSVVATALSNAQIGALDLCVTKWIEGGLGVRNRSDLYSVKLIINSISKAFGGTFNFLVRYFVSPNRSLFLALRNWERLLN